MGHTAKLRPVCPFSSVTPAGEPGADLRAKSPVKKTGCAVVDRPAYRHSHNSTPNRRVQTCLRIGVVGTRQTRMPEVHGLYLPSLGGTGILRRYPRPGRLHCGSSLRPSRFHLPGRTSRFRPRAIATSRDYTQPHDCGRINFLTMT